MSYKDKDINIKNHAYYFFTILSIKRNLIQIILNQIKKSYKNIFIYYIAYVTIKDSKYVKVNSVNPFYIMFNGINGYFEEINGNKYLTLVSTNESKQKIKTYEELQIKIRDLI